MPSSSELAGRAVIIVELDDARAAALVVALRDLGAKTVRFTGDDRSMRFARDAHADIVLVDGAAADGPARDLLAALAADPALATIPITRTDGSVVWASGATPMSNVIKGAVAGVQKRTERETKRQRAVPKADPTPPSVVVGPSVSARRVPSARTTEKYGVLAPIEEPPPAPPSGYVFPSRGASDVEEAGSSKETSIDLTAVPSSVLDRARLDPTDRNLRVELPPERNGWKWLVAAIVIAMLVLGAAFVMR